MENAKLVSTPLANHFRLSTTQCLKTNDDVQDMCKCSGVLDVCYDLYKTIFGTSCYCGK